MDEASGEVIGRLSWLPVPDVQADPDTFLSEVLTGWKRQQLTSGFKMPTAPRSRVGLVFRDAVFGLMGIPLVTRLAVGQSLRDPIGLPAPP